MPGRTVQVRVRRRGGHVDIDDQGQAVALAGRPPGWLQVAQRVVAEQGWNVNREGVVFLRAAAHGRDIPDLVRRTGEVSAAVFTALLELEDA